MSDRTLPPLTQDLAAGTTPSAQAMGLSLVPALPEGTGPTDAPLDSTAPAPTPPSGAIIEPDPGLRVIAGPRGTSAAVPQPVQEARGALDLLRRLGRITPDTMPAPRPMDFVERIGERFAIRPATEAEAQDIADILGNQGAAGRINLISPRGDYMPTDVQEFIGAIREANVALFDEARRGVQSREQQIAMAERLGLDGMVNRLLSRRPGDAFNNEELIAGAVTLVNLKRETDAAAAMMLTNPSPETQRAFGLNLALTAAVAGHLNGAVAEAGRALGALNFVNQALTSVPPGQVGMMAQRLGVMGQAGPHGLRVGANDQAIVDALGGAEVLNTIASTWVALPTTAQRNAFAQASIGRRVLDALSEAYINALLSSPVTHIRNTLGNATMGLWQVPERFLAGAIGGARNAVGLGSQERVYMMEAMAQLYGIVNGTGDALRAGATAFRTGLPPGAASKLDLGAHNAISADAFNLSGTTGRAMDLYGTVMRVPGRMLVTEDAFFRTIGSRMEMHAMAVRERNALIERGVDPVAAAGQVAEWFAHPPERWRDSADAFASAMTFQQEMGPGLAAVRQVMQHPVAKLVVPFFSTPTNIFRAALQRSPMGVVLSSQVRAELLAGGARMDLALSRLALGSSLMTYFGSQVLATHQNPDFRITGAEPTQPARREAFRRQGMQAYSICNRTAGEWTCRSYSGLDPVSSLLAMAADTAGFIADNPTMDDDDLMTTMEDLGVASVTGLFGYMTNTPMLQGVSDLAKILGDKRMTPEDQARHVAQHLAQKASEMLFAAVPVPGFGGALGGALERAIDPTSRSTMPRDPSVANSGPLTRGFYTALERAMARTPYAAGTGEQVLNLWGEEVRPSSGGAWELFWPIRTTSGQGNELEGSLLSLGGVLAMPSHKFPGTNVELSAAQYNALIRAMNSDEIGGQTMREVLTDYVTSPAYDAATPADRIAYIQSVRTERWRAAQERVMQDDADLSRRVGRDRAYRDFTGHSPRASQRDADPPTMQ